MLQIAERLGRFYREGNRWWLSTAVGFFLPLCMPPFNHGTHWLLAPVPFFTFAALVPLFALSMLRRGAAIHVYLFGVAASFGQYYWIANVMAEGLWGLILLGLLLLSLFIGLYYLAAGMLFRFLASRAPRGLIWVYPAVWICLEYARGLGEMSFPWMLLGYSVMPILPLAQCGSVVGVYGLSFLIVLGNVILWKLLGSSGDARGARRRWTAPSVFAGCILLVFLWGLIRLRRADRLPGASTIRVALVQPNIDQNSWGNRSLDTTFAICESLSLQAAALEPDCIVLPESALLTYLAHRPGLLARVEGWVEKTGTPLVVGTLHFQRPTGASPYRYLVYNSALLFDTTATLTRMYHKMKLVPFSEALPFEGYFPILSRVNLGEADFKKGRDPVVFHIGESTRAVPLICYEVIYPGFVWRRIGTEANLLLNITNDAWFGRSTAPFHHAAMARMRCVENGIGLARCANAGISMGVDRFGRVLEKTELYTRGVTVVDVPLEPLPTVYSRFGDWPVLLCAAALVVLLMRAAWSARRAGGPMRRE